MGNGQTEGGNTIPSPVHCVESLRDRETPAEHEQCDCVQGGLTEIGPEMLSVSSCKTQDKSWVSNYTLGRPLRRDVL